MGELESVSGIAKFLEGQWFEKTGLWASLLVVALVEIGFLTATKPPWWISLIILVVSFLLVIVAWTYSRRLPKTPAGKIGFLVSIASSDDKQSEKLREDFILPLRRLVNSGKSGKAFHFIELPQRQAKNILDGDDAQKLRVITRSHFILYGRIRSRNNIHYLNLDGVVAHNPVPEQIHDRLAKEFSELLPRKVQIPSEQDLLAFEFTSEWADIVARYIIGIAASLSGDLQYAESLFNDAYEKLQSKNKEFPAFQKLNKRIPIRISELYETRAQGAYLNWSDTKEDRHIKQLGDFLEKIKDDRKKQPRILNLMAIHAFLDRRDIESALSLLSQCDEQNNAVWHCNMAFLHGYQGNLKLSTRHYRKAMSIPIEPEVIGLIEDFICWVIEQEPEKYWLHFCLGFFNWKIKGDHLQSAEDLSIFLDACGNGQFAKEEILANKWLVEMG